MVARPADRPSYQCWSRLVEPTGLYRDHAARWGVFLKLRQQPAYLVRTRLPRCLRRTFLRSSSLRTRPCAMAAKPPSACFIQSSRRLAAADRCRLASGGHPLIDRGEGHDHARYNDIGRVHAGDLHLHRWCSRSFPISLQIAASCAIGTALPHILLPGRHRPDWAEAPDALDAWC